MASTSKLLDLEFKSGEIESKRSSIDSIVFDMTTTPSPPITRATTSRTASTSNISKTTTSTTSSTKSKRQRAKNFFKRIGNGMLESLAYYNAVEYSPAAVQYYESKKGDVAGQRTPDQVLNDIYGVHLFYW